jgi:DNA-3-methyladenine glycosylase II
MEEIVNKRDIGSLKKKDEIFGFISGKYGDPPNWRREPGFVSLCRIILEQQISLASANAHYGRLNSYLKEFTPENILKLSDEEMRFCQISRQKAGYLRALSDAVQGKRIVFEELENKKLEIVRQELTDIKGIGQWTTDIYLMFCLQKKDIFPFGDIAVINAVTELFPGLEKEEIKNRSDKWKPYRSLAAYYFWYFYLRKRNRSFNVNDMMK